MQYALVAALWVYSELTIGCVVNFININLCIAMCVVAINCIHHMYVHKSKINRFIFSCRFHACTLDQINMWH